MSIKIGLVGLGFAAEIFHLPFIEQVPELELAALCSRRPEQAQARWPGVAVYADLGQMLAEADIDLVVVTTPNNLHAPMARAALLAGKHVVVDKPFVVRAAEGEELVQLAAERGLLLSVYQNRRWDGDFLTVRRLLESGRLGRVKQCISHFDRWSPTPRDRWRETDPAGGGILHDLGPHLIDQALQLFGLPEALDARVRTLRPGGVLNDFFHLRLHYPQHEVYLQASPYVPGPALRWALYGERGSYLKHGLDPQEAALRAGLLPGGPNWGEEPLAAHGVLTTMEAGEARRETVPTAAGDYTEFYRAVARAIRGAGENPVSAAEALLNIRLIEAALRSAEEGRSVALR